MAEFVGGKGTLVTEGLIKNLNAGKIVASEAGATIPGIASDKIRSYLTDLVAAVLKGTLKPGKFSVAVKAAGLKGPELESMVVDIIWFMGVSLDEFEDEQGRAHLVEMTKDAMESGVTTKRLVMERLETDFLSALGLLGGASQYGEVAAFQKKLIRVNTTMIYKQNKFNLLREEGEGYSKLVTTLNRFGVDAISEESAAAEIATVQSLIGYFDLDPNRVFDLLLDCFEHQLQNKAFLKLMPLFRQSNMAHILGFKLQYYQDAEVTREVHRTPASLYALTATLVASGNVALDALYPHLYPLDKDAFKARQESVERRLKAASMIGKINLAETSQNPGDPQDEKEDHEAIAITEEQPTEENQKLNLVLGFLEIGAWSHASTLLHRLAPLEPAGFAPVGDALRMHLLRIVTGEETNLKMDSKKAAADVDMEDGEAKDDGVLPPIAFELMRALGVWIYKDVRVFTRACRALRAHLESYGCSNTKGPTAQGAKEAAQEVESALEACILPALTLVAANPAAVNEVWSVLSLLHYTARFRLYGALKVSLQASNPVLVAQRVRTTVETKKIMRRLSKENVKEFGRKLGKLAHADPLSVFDAILSQIEVYSNMTNPVVDAFKYLTLMGYDVLTYCVVVFTGGRGQLAKLKQDGINVSLWLSSLASFCGHLTRKYPGVELTALVQLLVHQLKDSQSVDLLVLKEVIGRMTGVEVMPDLSDDQLAAMAGGPSLRSEAFSASAFQTAGSAKSLAKGAIRLKEALLVGDDPLLAPLLVLISQQRTSIVFNTDTPHLKLIGVLYDNCQEALVQYTEFLKRTIPDPEEYIRVMPSLRALSQDYKLEPEVVFLIYRPVLKCIVTTPVPRAPADGETAQAEARKALAINCGGVKHSWDELINICRNMLPEHIWQYITPELYLTFWTLSLSDLHVPVERYEAEIRRQRSSAMALDKNQGNMDASSKARKERDRILALADKLEKELESQKEHVVKVKARLKKEKDAWLEPVAQDRRPDTALHILQICILPRVTFTYSDAVYCAKFVHELHKMDTPHFSTLQYYDRVMKDLSQLVSSCTEYEAARMGRFIAENLELLEKWRSDKEIYDKECRSRAGFAITFGEPNSKRATYDEFLRVSSRWHNKITKSLSTCLESDEYMHIRNALIVLAKIVKVYPRVVKHAVHLEKRVVKVRDNDEREDLQTVAKSYHAQLMSQKANWVSEEKYTPNMEKEERAPKTAAAEKDANPAGGARASGDRAGTSHGSHGGGGKDSVREEENGAARGGVVGAVKPHSRAEHNHDHHNASAHHVNNSNHNKEATSNSASVKDKDKEEPRSSGRRQKQASDLNTPPGLTLRQPEADKAGRDKGGDSNVSTPKESAGKRSAKEEDGSAAKEKDSVKGSGRGSARREQDERDPARDDKDSKSVKETKVKREAITMEKETSHRDKGGDDKKDVHREERTKPKPKDEMEKIKDVDKRRDFGDVKRRREDEEPRDAVKSRMEPKEEKLDRPKEDGKRRRIEYEESPPATISDRRTEEKQRDKPRDKRGKR